MLCVEANILLPGVSVHSLSSFSLIGIFWLLLYVTLTLYTTVLLSLSLRYSSQYIPLPAALFIRYATAVTTDRIAFIHRNIVKSFIQEYMYMYAIFGNFVTQVVLCMYYLYILFHSIQIQYCFHRINSRKIVTYYCNNHYYFTF